jgi:hypothetical protein
MSRTGNTHACISLPTAWLRAQRFIVAHIRAGKIGINMGSVLIHSTGPFDWMCRTNLWAIAMSVVQLELRNGNWFLGEVFTMIESTSLTF